MRRGEKGTPIWFWKWYEKEQPDGEKKRIPVLRRYTVSNVAQCDGIEDHVPSLTDPGRQPFSPIGRCERMVAAMPAPPEIRHGGRQAFYQLTADAVTMPARPGPRRSRASHSGQE